MNLDAELAELLGIHIGDGCISENERYSEYYLGGDLTDEKEYHDNWVAPLFNKKIMQPLFGKEVEYKEHPKVGVYGFYIFNKKLVNFFKKFGINAGSKIGISIPEKIRNNKTFLKRFLRGLFDTDGTIYFDKNYSSKTPINNHPMIKLGTVSKILADQVFDSLKELGFKPRMRKPYKGKRDKNTVYAVLLYKKRDIEFFINTIEFKNPKHYTKWQVFKILSHCPPNTTLKYRKNIIFNNSKNL